MKKENTIKILVAIIVLALCVAIFGVEETIIKVLAAIIGTLIYHQIKKISKNRWADQ